MATEAAKDYQAYYIPHNSRYPIWTAVGMIAMMVGVGYWLVQIKQDDPDPNRLLFMAGILTLGTTLYFWFSKVIEENFQGLPNAQLNRSYIWGMAWFIFSEVMFFFAFFAALFYVRNFAVPWLGGEGDKGLAGQYLWPEFSGAWPPLENPDVATVTGPSESMASPGILSWWRYLPFWNTVILLTSSVTVHMAHTALKQGERRALNLWMGATVVLGVLFLIFQAEEYIQAYSTMGLTLSSGIYGSTFFVLTGFHGFHVTLGTFMLIVITMRCLRGHFNANDQFGFEAVSWYWHFVDVVWLGLFTFVYLI